VQSEDFNIHQARDHGRNGQRNVSQRDKKALAVKIEARDRPTGAYAEQNIKRNRDGGNQAREAQRRDPADESSRSTLPSLAKMPA
jgi:hypothetical protein